MRTKVLRSALGVVFGSTLLFAGPGVAGASHLPLKVTHKKQLRPEITVIKYLAYPGSVDYGELAEELGYLKPLTLDSVGTTTNGSSDIEAVATDNTFYGHAQTSAIVNLDAAGANLTAVLTKDGINQHTTGGYYVLDSSPIKSATQLVGQKVAVNTLGAGGQAAFDQYMTMGHLSKSQIASVTFAILPNTDDEEALEAGDVAVASLTAQQAALVSNVRKLFTSYQIYGAIDDDQYVMSKDFAEKYPNTTRLLVAAMAKALVWSQTHPASAVRAEYDRFLTAHNRSAEIPDIATWNGASVNTRGGYMEARDFTYWIGWLKGQGRLTNPNVKARSLYTNAYNPYAPK